MPRHIPAAALLLASALAGPANAQPAPAERAPAAAPLAPADNFGAIYGTGNLATPPAGMVPPPPAPSATSQPGAPLTATPRALLLRPEVLQSFQNERIQPPINPIDYAGYVRESPLLRAFRKLQAEPTLDPALLVLLAWNHAALDMTSIDHTTAGQKTSFNGMMLSVFEPTYGEQFGPPRASRALAIVHLAMFEAASAIDPRFASYKPANATQSIRSTVLASVGGPAPTLQSASLSAAITQAAHDTLVALYPKKAALIDANMLEITILVAAQEATHSAGQATQRIAAGTAIGRQTAAAVLALRGGDGSTVVVDPTKCQPTIPGQPANTVLPAPLCWEKYFTIPVQEPEDPLAWTMDPISGGTLQLGSNWGNVMPFVITPHEFTPAAGITVGGTALPVPTATEAGFLQSLNEGAYGPMIPDPHSGTGMIHSRYGVRAFGGWAPAPNTPVPSGGGLRAITATQRTDGQTIEGTFWGYDATALLCAPPRLYNMLATSIYLDQMKANPAGHSPTEAARYLALVNLALADAGVAAWDGKFTYNVARPITYLRNKAPDPAHPDDGIWTPLGQVASNGAVLNVTPPFPAYPSGHAVFGAAVFTMIGKALNLDPNSNASAFDFVSDEYNGHTFDANGKLRPMRTLHYVSLNAASWENAESRIYLGIHWQRDADDGITLGQAIATKIAAEALTPAP